MPAEQEQVVLQQEQEQVALQQEQEQVAFFLIEIGVSECLHFRLDRSPGECTLSRNVTCKKCHYHVMSLLLTTSCMAMVQFSQYQQATLQNDLDQLVWSIMSGSQVNLNIKTISPAQRPRTEPDLSVHCWAKCQELGGS